MFQPVPPSPRNGFGTAALATALGGLLVCVTVLGGVAAGVVAVVLGVTGRARAARGEASNGPVAVAGIALGAVAVVASLICAGIWVAAWHQLDGGRYLECLSAAGADEQRTQACIDDWMNRMRTRTGVSAATPGST